MHLSAYVARNKKNFKKLGFGRKALARLRYTNVLNICFKHLYNFTPIPAGRSFSVVEK